MKEINPYLKEVEKYLVDLPILDRNKIISELNSEIVENREILKQPASTTADEKRVEAGFGPYKSKNSKSSFGKTILKSLAFMFVCFLIFIGFLVWKFTPLLSIDEENQKVTILGGLIDIDGKAGKFIVGDEVHFTESSYTNDFSGSTPMSAPLSAQKMLKLKFESGKFEIETHESSELTFECKLSSPPTQEMIDDVSDSVTIDFSELEGSNCQLKIPSGVKLEARGETASIELKAPHFDIDLELSTGNIIFIPSESRSYFYDLKVSTGNIDNFSGVDFNTAEHRIKIHLNTGNISR